MHCCGQSQYQSGRSVCSVRGYIPLAGGYEIDCRNYVDERGELEK